MKLCFIWKSANPIQKKKKTTDQLINWVWEYFTTVSVTWSETVAMNRIVHLYLIELLDILR